MPVDPSLPARDVYRVVGEDRTLHLFARGARWVGTVVAGLIDVGDAPALSDIVFLRLDDGVEVHRIREGSLVDFEKTIRAAASDLDTLSADVFAETWFPA
jgi:hypothetical protein